MILQVENIKGTSHLHLRLSEHPAALLTVVDNPFLGWGLAIVVGGEVVGVEQTGSVWGSSADVGQDNLTSLIVSWVLQDCPVTHTEHVTIVLIDPSEIDHSGHAIYPAPLA